MRKPFLSTLVLVVMLPFIVLAQVNETEKNKEKIPDAKTVGILIGGSLIGFDYEIRATPGFGIQVGGGLVGYALALNYHPQPTVDGPYLSLNYKDMGFGVLRLAGVEYCYRWYFKNNWGLAFQMGFGGVINYSDKYKEEFLKDTGKEKVPNAMLTYGIGITF